MGAGMKSEKEILQLRTRILQFEEMKDGYIKCTIMVDKYRDKQFFKNLVDSYKDDKIIILKWVLE